MLRRDLLVIEAFPRTARCLPGDGRPAATGRPREAHVARRRARCGRRAGGRDLGDELRPAAAGGTNSRALATLLPGELLFF